MLFSRHKTELVSPEQALRGRDHYEYEVPATHYVNGRPIAPPFPDGLQTVLFGSGCFWGTEEIFWQTAGVWTTAVVYAGGSTGHPSYEEVCSGLTGHTEAVLVVYDPSLVSFGKLLQIFFETHDPTQGMRQGNDRGTQYRSALYYVDDAQRELAEATAKAYGDALKSSRYGEVTTEIAPLRAFYYAEDYHQQYLAKVPDGYCGIAGTGVACPVGTGARLDR
jgi:peptide-methionine (S)-S-oxide reductase